MDDKKKVGISVVTLLVVFAVGRYTAPEKIKVETKIVEVEKKTEEKTKNKKKNDKRKTTKRKIVKPDGEVITEVIKEKDNSETDTTKDKTVDENKKTKEEKKEETRGNNKINISALAGFDMRTGKPIYGASISKSFIGPTTIGIWGLNNNSCGVTLGISF